MTKAFYRRLGELGFATYRDYLASPHWAEVNRRYRQSDLPQMCCACSEERFQLHHRTYARIGHEELTDFLPLCSECHRKVHEYEKAAGTRIVETHVILMRVMGWTRDQMWLRLRRFRISEIDNFGKSRGKKLRRKKSKPRWARPVKD